MTGIAEYKAQWEQQAREDERRQIVEWMQASAETLDIHDDYDLGWTGGILDAALTIKRGDHRKAKSE